MSKFEIVQGVSHTDHHLGEGHIDLMKKLFSDREGFFLETIHVPEDLPTLPNGIYGPSCGDSPVSDEDAYICVRKGRPWPSRVVDRPTRPSRLMTVIAGPTSEEQTCVLYTAFGGPAATKEPGDFSLGMFCETHSELWKALVNRDHSAKLIVSGFPFSTESCPDCAVRRKELRESVMFWSQHAISSEDFEMVKNSKDENLRNIRAKASLFLSVKEPGNRHEFTCDSCEDNLTCRWRYDPFNVEGRCLEK